MHVLPLPPRHPSSLQVLEKERANLYRGSSLAGCCCQNENSHEADVDAECVTPVLKELHWLAC